MPPGRDDSSLAQQPLDRAGNLHIEASARPRGAARAARAAPRAPSRGSRRRVFATVCESSRRGQARGWGARGAPGCPRSGHMWASRAYPTPFHSHPTEESPEKGHHGHHGHPISCRPRSAGVPRGCPLWASGVPVVPFGGTRECPRGTPESRRRTPARAVAVGCSSSNPPLSCCRRQLYVHPRRTFVLELASEGEGVARLAAHGAGGPGHAEGRQPLAQLVEQLGHPPR